MRLPPTFRSIALVWLLGGSCASGAFTVTKPMNRITPSFLRAATEVVGDGGPILSPSLSTDPVFHFDTNCVANPVVLPPCKENPKWQCYYYGNSGSWNRGHKSFLPSGWCGLAESDDGIHWTKIAGKEEDASILAPSSKEHDWDAVHIGVGDVVRVRPGELHMYYFGASNEEVTLGAVGNIVGFRMRIGRARSTDNGRTWEKMGMVLDFDKEEGVFASWPRIVVPKQKDQPWRMLYHSFNGQKWRVFGAESSDCGDTWVRTGLVLQDAQDDTCFDFTGIGTRAVTRWREGMLMIYEGVDSASTHRFGAAFCSDHNGGKEWKKLDGPIIEPGKSPLAPWTSLVVGTPYLVSMEDESIRLYHCARESVDDKMSIGMLVSDSGDIKPESWRVANAKEEAVIQS